jgi:hypothetical protein
MCFVFSRFGLVAGNRLRGRLVQSLDVVDELDIGFHVGASCFNILRFEI